MGVYVHVMLPEGFTFVDNMALGPRWLCLLVQTTAPVATEASVVMPISAHHGTSGH